MGCGAHLWVVWQISPLGRAGFRDESIEQRNMDKAVYVQLACTKTDQSIEVAAKKAKSDLN